MALDVAKTFPTDKLRPKGGEIYAHVLENPRANFPRQQLWEVSLQFEPVHYGGGDFTGSLACGFIPWKFRNWRSLAGASFEKLDPARGAWAGTFYTGEHNPAHAIRMLVADRAGDRFRVSVEMSVDLPEYDSFQNMHEARVAATAEVR